MKIKKPTSLLDILDLQKILDSNINSARERNLDDIKLSMIAEVIEFNEECECSHKTWKTKQVDVDKTKEEAVDVLFFMAQLINYFYRGSKGIVLKLISEDFTSYMKISADIDILKYTTVTLIRRITTIQSIFGYIEFKEMMMDLSAIYKMIGMTEEEVYKIYFDKWQKNMKRIGKEWN